MSHDTQSLLHDASSVQDSIEVSCLTECKPVTPKYDNADIAGAWRALVTSEAYPFARECLATLRGLFRSSLWRNRMEAGGFNRYVSLGGGGAPEEDRALIAAIRAAHRGPQRPQLLLIDRDRPMLDLSRHAMPACAERVANVALIEGDFMKLRHVPALRAKSGGTMWFLSGGTFGNQCEQNFANSIDEVAQPGDWLCLGIDMRDAHDPASQHKRLMAAYGSPVARRFYAIAAGKNPDQAAEELSIRIVDAEKDGHSEVRGTLSVIAKWPGAQPMLSNRYDHRLLSCWWSRNGWRELAIMRSRGTGTYCQLLLQRCDAISKAGNPVAKTKR